MNFELFLGRFHPLLVHLPIGFLLLAAILELLSRIFKSKFNNLDSAISISLFCGGLGAIGSAILGYLLSDGGGYEANTLFWHKWLGISLGFLSFIGWAVKVGYIKFLQGSSSLIAGTLVIIVSITGHLGGNLTHGSDYLFVYAPQIIQKIMGMQMEEKAEMPVRPDSVMIFEHLIKPTLRSKCTRCHNENKKNGGLLMTSKDGLENGGSNGAIIVPGKALESALFARTILPHSSKKFMPPVGEPLNYSELKILEWWLKIGASFETSIAEYEVPEEIQLILLRDYGVDSKLKPYFERIQVPQLSESQISEMMVLGLRVKPIANGNNLLSIKPNTITFNKEQEAVILRSKDQITWLDLNGKNVEDGMLVSVGQLTNLTTLNLNNNPITDEGLANITELKHLEVLNLYGTSVTDNSLLYLKNLSALKRIYIWKTEISKQGVNDLIQEIPGLQVVGGIDSN